MTERYSIENYLVEVEVLERLLRDAFPLDGEEALKNSIIGSFTARFEEYLGLSAKMNMRFYAASQFSIARGNPFAPRLSHIVEVEYASLMPSKADLSKAAPLIREPTEDEIDKISEAFYALDGLTRYRGKFHLMFFKRFVTLLAQRCREGCPVIFGGVKRANIRDDQFGLGGLAIRSPIPIGFVEYIEAISA